MKTQIIYLVLLLNACINAEKTHNKKNYSNNHSKDVQLKKDSNIVCSLVNSSCLWKIEIDTNGVEYLIKGDSIDYIKDDLKLMVFELNRINTVKLKIVKKHKNTLYVKILNSTYFTQSIGNTGADWYLAIAVFSFTENKDISYVDFDFEAGDAGGIPGKKSRGDFSRIYKLCK
jgi:hypothetical protein